MSVGYRNDGTNQQPVGQGADADWGTIKNDVGEIADAAVERGRHFMDAAREQVTDYMDRRRGAVAESVADLATSLRESTRSFEDRPNIRSFVDSAADGLNQLADSIQERSFTDIFNEVEDVVRRHPAVVAAVTVAAGFLTARFIKASAEGMRYGRDNAERSHGGQRQQESHASARG